MRGVISKLISLGEWNYLWWIPLLIVIHVVVAWMSKVNNDQSGNLKLMIAMFLIGGFGQLWVIVSMVSKRLIFDGMLYDNLLFLTYAITFAILGSGSRFTIHQWAGFMMVITGSVMLRICGR
jgi:hypothetical protein